MLIPRLSILSAARRRLWAPPGIVDARSWAYWHVICDREPGPLPERWPPPG